MVEVAFEHLGEAGCARVFGVEDRVVQILHLLAEGEHLFPLVECGHRLLGIGWQFQPIHLAEEPFDLGEACSFVALHRPVELFLCARFRLAARRTEPLAHDTHDQCQGVSILFQRLLVDEFLRSADAYRRVVLPVDNLEPGIPDLGRVAVVFVEKLAHVLPFRPDITGRGEEDVVLSE